MTTNFSDLQVHWVPVAPLLSLSNEHEHAAAVMRLNAIIDEVGTDETHPLYSFLDTLGTLISAYEARHHPIPDSSGFEVLEFLIDEHGLGLADLPELGSPDEAARVVAGEQEVSVAQVRSLAQRFGVSPAAFISRGRSPSTAD